MKITTWNLLKKWQKCQQLTRWHEDGQTLSTIPIFAKKWLQAALTKNTKTTPPQKKGRQQKSHPRKRRTYRRLRSLRSRRLFVLGAKGVTPFSQLSAEGKKQQKKF